MEIYDAYDLSSLHAKQLDSYIAQADIPSLCRIKTPVQRLSGALVFIRFVRAAHDLASRPGPGGERFDQRLMILVMASDLNNCCVSSGRAKCQPGDTTLIWSKSYIDTLPAGASISI